MRPSLTQIKGGALDKFYENMLSRMSQVDAVLARDVFKIYQNLQIKRWTSVTSQAGGVTSEGDQWDGLTDTYITRKAKRFASYPGSGRKILIAEGKLFAAAMGTAPDGRVLVEKGTMTITASRPYAGFVNDLRPFMTFSDPSIETMKDRLKKYFAGKP
jgi:hypothetical protein